MAELGPITCAGCGLLCDDVVIDPSRDSVDVQPRCELGAAWFSDRAGRAAEGPAATIRGEPTDVEAALGRAAELLRGARRPLIYGFDGATVEDARAAVALADRLGALVVSGHGTNTWPGAPAVPLRGASTATLGEIRDRSRVVVIWREDPETSHPRLLERLGLAGDASDRTLVVVDDRDTATARRADARLRWARRSRPRRAHQSARVAEGAGIAARRARRRAEWADRAARCRSARGVCVRTWPDWRRRRPATRARAAMSWCGRCATGATWSRSSCRLPPGRGAPMTRCRGRPGTPGRSISPAVTRSS